MLNEILSKGSIAIAMDAVLFSANEIRTAKEGTRNAGKPYLHGSFVGKDANGNWTSQKLLHVFPTSSHLDHLDAALTEDCFFLLTGSYDERETDAGNDVLSLSDARFAQYGVDGKYTFSDEKGTKVLNGEPGAFVTVKLEVKAQFRAAATLDGNRPKREKIATRRGRRAGSSMDGTTSEQPTEEKEPVGSGR